MATLSGNKIKDTYQSLIKLTDNGNLTTGAKQLTDGFGNNSPLYISTTQIGIGVTPEATYDLHVYSNAKVGGNLTVTGDLTVEGTTTTIDTQTLTVEDPLIEVASNNTSTDAVDIGWYGKYAPSGTVLYAGLFRDTGDSRFKLFRNLQEQPTTTVNTSGTGYTRADLVIGGLEATTGDFTDTVTVDGDIEVENSSGFGRIEIGGSSGAYIDLKSPFSDDFDLRLYTAGTNAQINAINGELDITANTNINLQYQGTDVLVMSSTGVAVTGTGSFTGQVTIPETPVADTDAASKGYVDSQITAQDLDFSGDSGTGAVDLDSQTLSITGGTLITTTALNQNLDIDHNSVSRTDTTSSASPAFGGTFTAVDSVTSSTEGHITAINLKTVTVPTPTYPTVNNNTITINAGSNLDTGGAFTLNQSFDETITIDLATTITGLSSVSSTTFSGQLDGTISSTTTATTQTQGDNSTKVATTAYVDSAIGSQDTLAEILANGNTTGGTDIAITAGDKITNFTSTGIDDNATSTALTIDSSQNATFAGDVSVTGGDLTLGTDAIASNINAVGDVLVLKVDSDEDSGGSPNMQFKVGASTELTINGTSSTFSGNIDINGNNKHIRFIDTYGNWIIEAGDGANNFKIHSQSLAADYLTLEGGGQLNLGEYGSGSFTGTATYRLAVDSTGDVIEIPIGDGAVDGSGTANYVTKWSDTDTITNSIIYDNGTNIGIGTTTPSAKLHIATGHIKVERGVEYRSVDTGGNTRTVLRVNSDNELQYGWSGAGAVTFMGGSSYTERMRIHTNGNIGIGTSSPNAKLDIVNSGLATQLRLSNTTSNATTKYGVITGRHYTNSEENVTGMLITSSSSVTGGSVSIGGGVSSANAVNNIIFYTAANNTTLTGTERMRIDSSGNVGIGGNNSSYKLISIGDYYPIAWQRSGGTIGTLYSDSTSVGIGVSNLNNAGIFFTSGQHIDFRVNGGTKMFLNSSGNVGIGTTSPSGELHVKSASGNSDLILERNGYTAWDISAGSTYLSFQQLSGSELMRIDSSGNVGIGQTSLPTNTRLNITGTNNYTLSSSSGMGGIKISGTTAGQGNYTSGIGFAFGSGTAGISGVQGTADSDTMGLAFFTHPSGTGSAAAEEKMRIDYLGNVGIGTTSPSYPLDVATSGNLLGRFASSGTASELQIVSPTVNVIKIDTGTSDVLAFGTTGTERMRIDSSGNIFATNSSGNLVLGNAASGDIYLGGGNANTSNIILQTGSSERMRIDSSGDTTHIASYGGGTMPFRVGYGSYSSFTPTFQIDDDGNVNIVGKNSGAGNTSMKLIFDNTDVTVQANQLGGGIEWHSDDGSGSGAGIKNSINTFFTGTGGYTDMRFSTAGTDGNNQERMRIDSSGQVGIGTLSPDAKLEVVNGSAGTARISSDGNGAIYSANGDVQIYTNNSAYSTNIYSANKGSLLLRVLNNGNVGIGTTSPASKLEVYGGGNTFRMDSAGNTSKTFLMRNVNTATAEIKTDGNLDINIEDANRTMRFLNGNTERMRITSGGYTEIKAAGGSSRLYLEGTSGTHFLTGTSGGDFGIYNDTASSYRMFINSSGNVGIGVTSPNAVLDIYSPYDVTANPNSTGIRLRRVSGGSQSYLLGMGVSGISNDYFAIRDITNSAYRFVLTNSGNVGIGATSPSDTLHVDMSAGSGDIFFQNNTSYQEIFYGTAQTNANCAAIRWKDTGLSIHAYGQSYGSQLFIDADTSNVGIGTTNPDDKLEVTEGGSAYAFRGVYSGTSGSYGAGAFQLTGGSTSPSLIDFIYSTTFVGQIVTTGSGVLYQSNSDYRLKENVVEMTGALDRVNQLNPSRFNFIGHEETVDGFLAHELQKVVPQAVSGEKDGTREDGTPKYQGVDNSQIVPLLVGAIKELKAEIETLKAQINN